MACADEGVRILADKAELRPFQPAIRYDSSRGSVRIPTLILEGDADRPVRAQRFYEAAREPRQLALIPGGGRGDSAEMNPAVYFGALNGFLSQHHFRVDRTTGR